MTPASSTAVYYVLNTEMSDVHSLSVMCRMPTNLRKSLKDLKYLGCQKSD